MLSPQADTGEQASRYRGCHGCGYYSCNDEAEKFHAFL